MTAHPNILVIHTLPEVHKNLRKSPRRTIISGPDSLFYLSAQILDEMLRPYSKAGKSYIKDTPFDFLNKISMVEIPCELIIDLLDCLLSNIYFLFKDQLYKQVSDTAMGCNIVPTYTVLFVNEF